MNTTDIWNSFLDKLKMQVSSLSFETWFKDNELYSIDANNVVVIVPMSIHKNHLEENYKEEMENIFYSLTGKNLNFVFKLREELEDIIPVEYQDFSKQNSQDANLNPNYTFDTFIVGDSNNFAYKAAVAVAERPGKSYNPLFIYGKSGLGKTHLMHAIGNHVITNTNKKVLYVSSDTFVNDYISAVRYTDKTNYDKVDSFKNKYRNIDVLIIDDIQFLSNYNKGQDEFFHTFNELYNSNKQIIIASDRSVDDLRSLENRLLTRFNWGLTANITPPDHELRVSIIRNKIKYQESAEGLDNNIIEYIANNYASDVRQLEGAITRVFAYSSMMNHGIVTMETAIDALKDQLTDRSVYKNDIHRIQRIVADYFKISIDDLKGKKRTQDINYPRQIAIYLARTVANESFPKIGTHFGGRDHSTIMSSYNKIDSDLKTNKQLITIIDELKKNL